MATHSLRKAAPAWHAEAVDLIKGNFDKIHGAFMDATKRAVWLGMFLYEVKSRGKKDGSIPHGHFRDWLAEHVPDVHFTTASSYMLLATNVCEKGNIQMKEFPSFENSVLPPQVLKIIEGKTQQQLFFEFKQAKTDADGNLRAAVGRRKGEGGASALQRKLAKMKRDDLDLKGRGIFLRDVGNLCDQLAAEEYADPQLGEIFAFTFKQVENLYRFMARVQNGRRAA